MVEKIKNIVLYLLVDELLINRKPRYIGGLHGYTYLLDEEGKKRLQKGVPTTTGYFVGNARHSGSVVNISDYLLGTVSNASSHVEPCLSLLKEMFTEISKPENIDEYKNICIISKYPLLEKLLKMDLKKLEENNWTIGKIELTPDNAQDLKDLQQLYQKWTGLDRKVIFDVNGAVEGGPGNKLASKQSGLGKIETTPNGKKRVFFEFMTKKEYEDPQTDFNKIVCAGRWYFNTGEGSEFYDDFHGYRAYNFGQVEPDKKYYGKLTSDVTFATLYCKEPIQLLDKLFDYARKLIPNPNEYLSAGILNNVMSKDVARIIDTFPGIKAGKDLNIPFESAGKEEPTLIELIDPPVMSYQIRSNIEKVHHLFDLFMTRDEKNHSGYTRFMDITDRFYEEETNKKGVVKRKLHSGFTQKVSTFQVAVEHPNAVIPVPLNLSVGYDLPDRNSLNSCVNENVKVWLGYDVQNPHGIRYFCVVESEQWVYIQMSSVANLRILNIKELGKQPPVQTPDSKGKK